jgi:hypothetical protein
LLTVLASLACAQNEKTTYTTDINGSRVASAVNDNTANTHRELSQTINGHTVPLEATETRIVSKSGNRTVTETITKKFNPTGGLAETQRLVTETETFPNGGSNQTVHLYNTDVNGASKEIERRQVEERVQGSSRTTETLVERQGLSGAFQTTEKRSAKTDTAGPRTETSETVYRVSQNGDLYPALQQVKVQTRVDKNTVSEQVADYEPGVSGKIQLARQRVSTSVTDAAGNETKETSLYAAAADGRVQEAGAPQQVKEQQTVTRHVSPDGKVTESLSVRRPTISDPSRLGNPQVISETVCTGKCTP